MIQTFFQTLTLLVAIALVLSLILTVIYAVKLGYDWVRDRYQRKKNGARPTGGYWKRVR